MFSLSFSLTKSMGTVFHKTRPVKDVHNGKRHLGYSCYSCSLNSCSIVLTLIEITFTAYPKFDNVK